MFVTMLAAPTGCVISRNSSKPTPAQVRSFFKFTTINPVPVQQSLRLSTRLYRTRLA